MGLLIGWDVNDEGVALYCGFCFLLGEGVSSFYVYSLLGAFLAPYSKYLSKKKKLDRKCVLDKSKSSTTLGGIISFKNRTSRLVWFLFLKIVLCSQKQG